jgi:hypothetical protein
MPKKAASGEERNKQGKCYMHACNNALYQEIDFFGKRVMVCRSHKSLHGIK